MVLKVSYWSAPELAISGKCIVVKLEKAGLPAEIDEIAADDHPFDLAGVTAGLQQERTEVPPASAVLLFQPTGFTQNELTQVLFC